MSHITEFIEEAFKDKRTKKQKVFDTIKFIVLIGIALITPILFGFYIAYLYLR